MTDIPTACNIIKEIADGNASYKKMMPDGMFTETILHKCGGGAQGIADLVGFEVKDDGA